MGAQSRRAADAQLLTNRGLAHVVCAMGSRSPSIVPEKSERDVQLVLEDFGGGANTNGGSAMSRWLVAFGSIRLMESALQAAPKVWPVFGTPCTMKSNRVPYAEGRQPNRTRGSTRSEK